MKENKTLIPSNFTNLRQKAEEMMLQRPSGKIKPLSDAETKNLLYELEIQRLELELQKEELLAALSRVESLKQSERTLKAYLENSIDVIHTVNKDGEFIFVSNAWEQYFGIPGSEVIGKKFMQFIHPNDVAFCAEYVKRTLDTGVGGRSPAYRVKGANGQLRWIVTNGKSYIDPLGNVLFIGVSHDITERINAEEALRRSEERFSLSMDATSDGLWDWDIPSSHTYYSPGYFRMLGYEPNEFEDNVESWKNLIHPDDLPAAVSSNEACINNISQNVNVEFRMKAKDGTWRWILGRGKAVERDSDGKALRMIGTHVDITARKQAEEALLRKDALLTITGLTAKIGGWEYDVETMKLTWTDEVYRIYEVDFSFDPNRDSAISFYAPVSKPLIENALKKAIEFGEPFDLELEFITKYGNHRWVHSIGMAQLENRKIKKVYGSFQDITHRKQVEENLRASEALYRAIINASPDQITVADMEGRIVMYSPATLKMFGYELTDQLKGRLLTDFLAPEDRELAASHIALRMQGIKHGPNVYHAMRADGSTFYLEVNGEFIQPEEGETNQILFVGRDISYRKQAEFEIKLKNEQLLKLNAEKDKFFSIISHDMRGPFNGFLGYTKILAEQLPSLTDEQIQKIASDMNKSATNVFGLLENLLQWARIRQGLIPFKPERLRLHQLAKRNIQMVKQMAEKKEIEINIQIEDDTVIFADRNMLQTVIRNLLSNAVKFTPRGGEISLSANRSTNKCVEFSVQDSGIGLNTKMVEDLFQIDIKSNRLGTEGEPSTGLGLLLCKEFVEKNGGKIWVESQEGKGSTFRFTLPENILP